MKKNCIGQIVIAVLLCFSLTSVKAQQNGGDDHHGGQNVDFIVAAIPELSFAMVASTGSQSASAITQVSIYDMSGHLMLTQNYTGNVNVASIDYSRLSPNLYVLAVSNAATTHVQVLGVNYPVCPPWCGGGGNP